MDKKIILFQNKIDCCGCWACANVCTKNAIKMQADGRGYLYPKIDESLCIGCGSCLAVCPIKKRSSNAEAESRKPHIKIINCGDGNNFGAVIAAACLENSVRSLVPYDYVVQTLNYNHRAEHTNKFIKFKSELTNRKDFAKIVARHLKSEEDHEDKNASSVLHDNKMRSHRYNKFRNTFLNCTVKMDNDALNAERDNDVALICGSDVIWMPSRIYLRSNKGYYLNFGSPKAKRIAFAASLDAKMKFSTVKRWLAYRRRLADFDAVSVRETENLKFIQSTVPKLDVRHCVDPVFLYKPEQFNSMIATSEEDDIGEDYIYAYILMNNDEAYKYTKKLANEKNLKVCYFADYYNDFGENSVDCYSDGPAEFLQRIKNAKYVVTTSFHCIVFSLLFKKRFVAFERGNNSVKISDILKIFELPDRLITDGTVDDIDKPIDFERVEKLIERYRGEATEFLTSALKDV